METERAFKPEFLHHMKEHKSWPLWKQLKIWCDGQNRAFIRNGAYTNVAGGEYVAERYARIVVEYLLDPTESGPAKRRVLDAFLIRAVSGGSPPRSAHEILELLTLTRERAPDYGFGLGSRVLLTLLGLAGVTRHVRPIPPGRERPIQDAVEWMFVDVGRQLRGDALSPVRAVAEAQAKIGMSLEAYQERVLAWHKREPWSVTHAVGRGGKDTHGMCIALPVASAFYERARSGACAPHDCEVGDIEGPSPSLILQAIAPESEARRRRQGLDWSLAAGVLCQLARLSDVPGLGTTHPVRILSFRAVPESRRRLDRFGFKPVGKCFPGTDVEYTERVLSLDKGGMEPAYVGAWLGLQRRLRKIYGDRSEGRAPL